MCHLTACRRATPESIRELAGPAYAGVNALRSRLGLAQRQCSALVGGYLWWRLVKGTTRPQTTARRRLDCRRDRRCDSLGPIALIAQYALPIAAQRVLIGWPGWLCYGLLIFLATATVLTEPVRIWWWWQRRRSQRALEPRPSRHTPLPRPVR